MISNFSFEIPEKITKNNKKKLLGVSSTAQTGVY